MVLKEESDDWKIKQTRHREIGPEHTSHREKKEKLMKQLIVSNRTHTHTSMAAGVFWCLHSHTTEDAQKGLDVTNTHKKC